MHKYMFTTFFLLAAMAVTPIKVSGKKRKEKSGESAQRNQDVLLISLINSLKTQPVEENTWRADDLKEFGEIEVQNGRVTVVVPAKELKEERKKRKNCKNCKRFKRKENLQQQQRNNQTRSRTNLKATLTQLKSHNNPVVIMKADDLRKDWCRTERVKHKITEEGCRSKTIINNFCYGQCNSFFIPRQIKGRRDLSNFQSCAYCQPYDYRWMSVTLQCPALIPPVRRKRIFRVDRCRCSTNNVT